MNKFVRSVPRWLFYQSGVRRGTASAAGSHSSGTSQTVQDETAQHEEESTHWLESLHWTKHVKTGQQLVQHLVDNVVFENDHILAINKPAGLPYSALRYIEENADLIKDEAGTEDLSIMGAIEGLQKSLNAETLLPVYSQPRLFSGIILFAKNEESKEKLQKYFFQVRKQKQSYQTYWAVTVSIPHSISDSKMMPVQRIKVGKQTLSVEMDEVSKRKSRLRLENRITVGHRVLSRNHESHTALVEVNAFTTKWDCLQLYLLHQLSPVLGDHLYSSRFALLASQPVLLDPTTSHPLRQKLHAHLLQHLHLSKKHALDIPLHLHCCHLRIPNFNKSRRSSKLETRPHALVNIHAPPSPLFMRTLTQLSLDLPNLAQVVTVQNEQDSLFMENT